MKNSAQQNMKAGDVSLGLTYHFIGAFGRAGGTPEMLQQIADDQTLMQKFVGLFQPTVLAAAIGATFVTSSYFITRPELWVSEDFQSRITFAYPEALVPRGLEEVESFDLTNESSDKAILARPEMGGEEEVRKHAFTPDQIADLIDLQLRGLEGKLLTNSGANLFYVFGKNYELFVVSIDWDAGRSRWDLYAWRLGEFGGWGAGCRVLRNTQALGA